MPVSPPADAMQTRVTNGPKRVAPMWSKPELCILNVTTACLSVCSVGTWKKCSIAGNKNIKTYHSQGTNSDSGRAHKSWGTTDLAILA